MMIKTKCLHEEDKPLLVFALNPEKLKLSEDPCETAVTRGAVNYLGRWPAHLFAAFITGSMVAAAFILFGIIVVAFMTPSEGKYRMFWKFETMSASSDLYFIKHENRSWNSMELCYIESTAKTWENLTVYLITLVDENRATVPLSKSSDQMLELKSKFGRPISMEILDKEKGRQTITKEREFSDEWRRRRELTNFYSNIKNIELPIRHFFNGSMLVNVYDKLSSEMLELAARAYVLWNFPGVAMDPTVHENLESLKRYLCKNENGNNCITEKAAAVKSNGDILASSVPCQAFIGYLIKQIATNDQPQDRQRAIEAAIDKFCPRSFLECPGVQRIPQGNSGTEILELEKLNCPVVISTHGMFRENRKKGTFDSQLPNS